MHRAGDTAHTEVLGATETDNPELELEKLNREWREEEERFGSVGTFKRLQLTTWLAKAEHQTGLVT